jgi:hypothetical protein
MTAKQFTERIRRAVYESSVEGVIGLLQKPPGRRPSPTLVDLSQWFNQLPLDEKERVRATIHLAVRASVFGMLTVLDGVTSIRENGEPSGSLELRYNSEEQSVLLNDPAGELLHDLFASQVPPE